MDDCSRQDPAYRPAKEEPRFGGALLFSAACDPLQPTAYAILSYNFGSLREPVVFQFWIPSVLLFGLSLLGLHWYEQDERKRKRAALAPVPVPTPGA